MLLFIIYIAFISLGLPDSLLGSAWPAIYTEFHVPVSYMGIIFIIISVGTVLSSLQSDRLTSRLGTGTVVVLSIALTCIGLFGFSFSRNFVMMCLFAVPYGLGAGSIDAALNNYVALHFKSRHMSWLHCMWGIGASIGPYIMGYCMTGGRGWQAGYRTIGLIQAILTAFMVCSLPLWKKEPGTGIKTGAEKKILSLREIFRIPGAKQTMLAFFCYCALEQTAGQWAATYLKLFRGIPAETAAGFASLFFIGITVGRMIDGFLTFRFNDTQMIRMGECIAAVGILLLLFPLGDKLALAGLVIIGLGCAPVYPSLIHSTPERFGADRSQAVIGVQMASAYVGTTVMPPLFGLIANHTSFYLLPFYLTGILVLMTWMHERARILRQARTSGRPT